VHLKDATVLYESATRGFCEVAPPPPLARTGRGLGMAAAVVRLHLKVEQSSRPMSVPPPEFTEFTPGFLRRPPLENISQPRSSMFDDVVESEPSSKRRRTLEIRNELPDDMSTVFDDSSRESSQSSPAAKVMTPVAVARRVLG